LAFSRVLDALIFALCFVWAWWNVAARSLSALLMTALVVPVSLALLDYFGVYESHRLHGFSIQIRQLLSVQLLAGALFGLWGFLLDGWDGAIRTGYFLAASAFLLICEKFAARHILTTLRRRGRDHRNVGFIGKLEDAERMAAEFAANPGWGLQLVFVGVDEPGSRRFLDFPTRNCKALRLEEAFRVWVVDELWIGVPLEQLAAERETIAACDAYGLLCRFMLFSTAAQLKRADLSEHNGVWSLGIGGLGHSDAGMAAKRILDIVLAGALLMAAAPVMLAAAILVKLSSPGPIFFRQWRAGLRGRRFRMYKFRTMIDGAETMASAIQGRNITRGPVFKDPADTRITPIGRVLRRFSIDELPQLWNVLRGEMSLVGPRPLPLPEAERVGGTERKRFSMRPGLTCIWQVEGRSDVEYAQWMRYDLQYVEDWSLWLDLILMLKTLPAVVSGRGAY
jgi:exopolysaccharide biosynthesis polyprenyl glycosylphosphotransferase